MSLRATDGAHSMTPDLISHFLSEKTDGFR